jgi:glycosyltransferase involved in cell wall biosynthesis
MNRVLIITYYWPPGGGAGVQRWLKFSKYLPEYGWEPVILTVDPYYAAYPALDLSLNKEVPDKIKVHRTKATDWFRLYSRNKSAIPSSGFATNIDNTCRGRISRFIRGNFFIPDPRRGWNRFAFKKACDIIDNEDIKNIITTSPPHSTQLIGLRLKKKYPELKWIADLRDPWTDIFYYDLFYPTVISKSIDKHYERSVLKKADLITTVGATLGRHFGSRGDGIAEKIRVIHNGFDYTDFQDIEVRQPGNFTISYIGTLSESYPIEGFTGALRSLLSKGIDFSFKLTGIISDNQRSLLESSAGIERLEFIPYADHRKAIENMMSSSLLLLVIARHRDNKSFLSGKIFEYIASGRPVLCLGPVDGDAAEIIHRTGSGRCFDYMDTENIEKYILSVMSEPETARKYLPVEFSRKYLTGEIARLL